MNVLYSIILRQIFFSHFNLLEIWMSLVNCNILSLIGSIFFSFWEVHKILCLPIDYNLDSVKYGIWVAGKILFIFTTWYPMIFSMYYSICFHFFFDVGHYYPFSQLHHPWKSLSVLFSTQCHGDFCVLQVCVSPNSYVEILTHSDNIQRQALGGWLGLRMESSWMRLVSL